MNKLFIALLMLSDVAAAQDVPDHQYPATSWTYNVDFKDPDAIGPFFGRDLVEGQWKGGVDWSPISIYHVDDAAGAATKWFTAGAFLVTNAEKLNATLGPTLGIEVLRWTSRPEIAGPIKSAANTIWKPLGYADLVASINTWGGWTPIHTSDVKHNYCGGFGFKLKIRFTGMSASETANSIIKTGL